MGFISFSPSPVILTEMMLLRKYFVFFWAASVLFLAASPLSRGLSAPQTTVGPVGPAGPDVVLDLRQGVNGYTGVHDTWITSFEPDRSNGNHDRLEMRGQGQASTLIRFDLARVPADATIVSAALTLSIVARSNDNPAHIGVYQMRRPWDAATATWLLAAAGEPWAAPGAASPSLDRYEPPVTLVVVSDILIDVTWDVTVLVRDWHERPNANFGMLLTGVDGAKVSYAAHSSQSIVLDKRPLLRINYQALPSTTTPTPTATLSPTTTLTPTPSPTLTSTPFLDTATPTPTPTPTPLTAASATPTPTATVTPTATPQTLAIDQALPIACGELHTGDTSAWPARVERYPSCRPHWRQNGPEAIYQLDLSNTVDLAAHLIYEPGQRDLDLFLLTGPGPDDCLAGADLFLTWPVLSPGRYYLVVDGYEGSAGPYQLHLTCVPHLNQPTYLPLLWR